MRKTLWIALALLLAAGTVRAEGPLRPDGLHTQPWIKGLSFLVLADDMKEAVAAGRKGLVVIFEQLGCPGCERLHKEVFADKDVVALLSANFDTLQINIHGSQEVTGFDGKAMTEKDYARKTGVNFTPTTLFLDPAGREVFRIPGPLPAVLFKGSIEYVLDGAPQRGILFPQWAQERREKRLGR
ncbi:MAG: thioredoxin family protein [Magnetospirillum sp. WYHS-4]